MKESTPMCPVCGHQHATIADWEADWQKTNTGRYAVWCPKCTSRPPIKFWHTPRPFFSFEEIKPNNQQPIEAFVRHNEAKAINWAWFPGATIIDTSIGKLIGPVFIRYDDRKKYKYPRDIIYWRTVQRFPEVIQGIDG